MRGTEAALLGDEKMITHTGLVLMALVSLQTGIQPLVTRSCVTREVSGQSLVIAELMVSITLALLVLPSDAFATWSVWNSATSAGPPAIMYALRSLFKQSAYRLCDGVTFNVMNQTKVVFCALATFVLLGEVQSFHQCLALFCAMLAGVLLVTPARASPTVVPTKPKDEQEVSPKAQGQGSSSASGAVLALITAACSGFAAALSQAAMRYSARPSTLFNLELGIWGLPFVLCSGGTISKTTITQGWRWVTAIPVVLQATGGLLVSALVKQQGGVAMGLCTVVGISVSAVVDSIFMRRLPSARQFLASALCAMSVGVHQLGPLLLLPIGGGSFAEQAEEVGVGVQGSLNVTAQTGQATLGASSVSI